MNRPSCFSAVAAGFSPRHGTSRTRSFSSGPLVSAALHFALLFALNTAAIAQQSAPIVLHLDPAATQIQWTLNTTVHTVHGTFKLKDGNVKIDPVTGEASGLIVVDATTGESAEPSRDKRMHAVILESAKYPTITFRPTHVTGKIDLASSGSVDVTGVFSLHGQDHPLQLTIHLHPQTTTFALTTQFTIPFVAWGLKDPSTFIFRTEKQVTIDIEANAPR